MSFNEDWTAFWDTPSELIKGFCVGLIACFAWGLYGVWVAIACAIFWRMGGIGFMDTNAWRRFGVPIALSLTFFLQSNHWINFVAVGTMALALSQGYGIPDSTDEGSWLGRHLPEKFVQPVWFTILAVASIPLYL